MSIIPGPPYELVNEQWQDFALGISKKDHKSIIAVKVESGDVKERAWISEFLLGRGETLIKSQEDPKLYIGFDGPAEEGRHLILVPRPRAKVWIIEPHHGDYKFRLKNTQFLIEFPGHDVHEGTPAQLGEQFLEAPNQIWKFILVK